MIVNNKKTLAFLKEHEFVTNETGTYIYISKDGVHRINLAAILDVFMEYEEPKYMWAVIYNEDEFEGIEVPLEWKGILETISKAHRDVFSELIYNEKEYNATEIEYAHQAKDGSKGTKFFDSFPNFRNWFFSRFTQIYFKGEILQLMQSKLEETYIEEQWTTCPHYCEECRNKESKRPHQLQYFIPNR